MFISKAIIPLFPTRHVRIFYGPPPTQYADGLSDLCRTCIGGESEVVRGQVMFVAAIYWIIGCYGCFLELFL